nr:helix-turn-helix domain-containing protein [Pedobacter polysacchareus]
MKMDIITMEDLQQFKTDFMQDIKDLLAGNKESHSKEWLRSAEVRKMLKISGGTLQNLRISGTLPYRKIGGSMYYDKSAIVKILEG